MEVRFLDEKILTHGNRRVHVKLIGSPLGAYHRNLIVNYLDIAYRVVVHFESIEPAMLCFDLYTAEKWLTILRDNDSVLYGNVSFGNDDRGQHMTFCLN